MTEQQIEKPWCVYGGVMGIPIVYVKVVKECNDGKTLEVIYSERQLHPPKTCDARYVKRFDTLLEALRGLHIVKDCYAKLKGWKELKSWKELIESAHKNFPREDIEGDL